MKYLFLVCCASFIFQLVSSDAAVNHDSYINALHESHKNSGSVSTVAREDYDYHNPEFHGGYDYQPAPIKPHYDAPAPVYGPPKPVYGPPAPVYGPPPHPPIYHHHHPREHWLLDKFRFNVDLFTIGKILLKLIIFKKIVKFIALICLLLFLPKLHMKEDDDSGSDEHDHDHGRLLGEKEKLNSRINEVTNFALTAFETFSKKYEGCEREQIWCRVERMFDVVDEKYPYSKIVKLYLPDNDIETNKVATD